MGEITVVLLVWLGVLASMIGPGRSEKYYVRSLHEY
jgi:hypothetical protein